MIFHKETNFTFQQMILSVIQLDLIILVFADAPNSY